MLPLLPMVTVALLRVCVDPLLHAEQNVDAFTSSE